MWGYNFDFWEMLKRKSERFWFERGKACQVLVAHVY